MGEGEGLVRDQREQSSLKTLFGASLAQGHKSFLDRWVYFLFSINSNHVNDLVSLFALLGSLELNLNLTIATVGEPYSLSICVSFSCLPPA